MKQYVIFSLVFVLSLKGYTQNIKGMVIDENNHPLEFANVILLNQLDSTFVVGTTTDLKGTFILQLPFTSKSYLIKISCVGYKTVYTEAIEGNMGNLIMKSDELLLGEVVVKGNLPRVRLKRDALITNVAGSVLAKAGTAEDVLGKIPGVTAASGEVNVFGRGTPVIYINGREVHSASELDQLSSEDIKSVEVIMNPGARYAASVKAVIRIQTKKVMGEGFGFSNRAYAKYNKKWTYLDQLNFNYRKSGFDFIGMLYYADSYWWRNYKAIQNTHLDVDWNQNSTARQKNTKDQLFIGNLSLNYIINPSHSLGASYRMQRVPNREGISYFITDVYKGNAFDEHLISDSYSYKQSTQHLINFYYVGKICSWDIDFNMDILWNKDNDSGKVLESITDKVGVGSLQQITNTTNTRNRLYAGKLLFIHSLWGGKVTLGGEYAYTKRNNDYNNLEGILRNDVSEIKENSTALFVEYSHRFGKLNIQGGVRFENVASDYYEAGVRQDEQSKDYTDFFPSLSLSMPVGKVEFQFNYTSDITRPSYHMLRSNVEYANRYTYESGNPLLQPSITHNATLIVAYRWLQWYNSYQYVQDDFIFQSDSYAEENPTIGLFKMKNASAYNKLYIFLNASPTIKWWSPQFRVGVNKQWYKTQTSTGNLKLYRPQYFAEWQNTIDLSHGFMLSADIKWNSKGSEQNMLYESTWGVDASIYKTFLKDHLTMLVQGNDVFKTRSIDAFAYLGRLRTMSQKVEPDMRSIRFTVRYKFNVAKSNYKGTGAGKSQKERL